MTAPAAMPSEEEIQFVLAQPLKDDDWVVEKARAVLALFAPILAEKSLHHETGERITRKDLNNAHRKGAEEGRLAAHLIDGVNSPLNACCYRDHCKALEARALAAEAALAAVKEAHLHWIRERGGIGMAMFEHSSDRQDALAKSDGKLFSAIAAAIRAQE